MMKKILLLLVLFFGIGANAQDFVHTRAKRLFERTFYSQALPMYASLVAHDRSLEVLRNLADCYYYTNDLAHAAQYYRLLCSQFPDLPDEYHFRYVQSLKALGQYDEAYAWIRKRLSGSEAALQDFEAQVKQLENISSIGERFEIKNLPINTPLAEFGAIRKGDSIVFAGIIGKEGNNRYKWNDQPYLDLLWMTSENATKAASFSPEINTALHEANTVFSADGKTVYFTRNNTKNDQRARNDKKVSTLQLYKAIWQDGKWSEIQILPFCNAAYSFEHPALSPDGAWLYFASDMPGTLGSLDLFRVAVRGNSFGLPENLGATINTAHKEQFPFLSSDGKLYFSSNGHFGYGLMDVFVATVQTDGFSAPLNVGLPVNSGYDDFAFNIDAKTKMGFFASDRPGGKGSDDLYSLRETKPLDIKDCAQWIAGTITDVDTQLPLDQAVVILKDAEAKELRRLLTGTDGKFQFEAGCDQRYSVWASKDGYSQEMRMLNLGKTRDKVNDASMALKSAVAIEKQKQAEADQQRKDAALAQQKQLEADRALALAKKKEKEQALLEKEKDVVRDKDRLLIKTEPIYFDYDLWYIRKESKPILNRVIELMKRYPDMVVEIGSHTDVRGNNAYNLELSSKRAASTREYFLKMGIPASRIFAKGYGETMPIIPCVPDHSCSEEQHELNRRSEFVIKNL